MITRSLNAVATDAVASPYPIWMIALLAVPLVSVELRAADAPAAAAGTAKSAPIGATSGTQAGGRIAVERTRVSLIPPPGMKRDPSIRGFSDDRSGISILISEIPAAPAMTTRAFTPEGFKKQGMTFLAKESAKFGEVPGLVIDASGPRKGGGTENKTIAAIGEIETSLITATYPAALPPARVKEIRAALLSARIRPEFGEQELDRSIPEPFLKMIPADAGGN